MGWRTEGLHDGAGEGPGQGMGLREGFEVNSLDFCRELGNGDRGSEMRQSISLNSFPAS